MKNNVVLFYRVPADVLDWLDETFGYGRRENPKSVWEYVWSGVDCLEIKFHTESAKSWFLLRWANEDSN